MKYVKETFEYLFTEGKGKKFLFYFLISLVPSALISACFSVSKGIKNLVNSPDYANWGELWMSYFNSDMSFIAIAVGVIALILVAAAAEGLTISHFRTGSVSIKKTGRSFNDYFMPSVIFTFLSIALYALFFTIYTLVSFMWFYYFNETAYAVLSFISFFVFLGGAVYIISALTLWFPSMCIMGIYTPSAMLKAFYGSRTKQKYFLPGHIVCILVVGVFSVVSYFTSDLWYVSWILSSIGYALGFAFYYIFVTVAYFGENCLPREDLNRRYR